MKNVATNPTPAQAESLPRPSEHGDAGSFAMFVKMAKDNHRNAKKELRGAAFTSDPYRDEAMIRVGYYRGKAKAFLLAARNASETRSAFIRNLLADRKAVAA